MPREGARQGLPVAPTLDPREVEAFVRGQHEDPASLLGPHLLTARGAAVLAIRAFLPEALSASVRIGRKDTPMVRLQSEGFYEAVLPAPRGAEPPHAGERRPGVEGPPGVSRRPGVRYRLAVRLRVGGAAVVNDPYRFPPILGDLDLHLFREGTDRRLHEKLGAHPALQSGKRGTHFAVWAPNATGVSVVGSFNRWDERVHPLRPREGSGLWELFIPGVGRGALYKYSVRTAHGVSVLKADPCGFSMERRPNTASIVEGLGRRRWRDAEWMAGRASRQAAGKPLSVYEVHLGSWRRRAEEERPAEGDRPAAGELATVGDRPAAGELAAADGAKVRWLTYRELGEQLVPYAREMGFTHLELLPVTEHPLDGSWGYQTVGYFAPTSRFGTPDDFRGFVDRAHRAGLGVILDWVPAHFPKDAHGLGYFDGTHLYEHADPRKGQHRDWGTYVFNFGRPQVREFLLSSAMYWLEEFHADGLRVDAVASMLYLDYSRGPGEWVPNRFGGRENLEAVDFLREFNERVHERFPGVLTFAEESTSWPGVSGPVGSGGLGFDMKWNMGWMNDTLEYFRLDPLARRHHQNKLTFSLMYAFSESFLLPLSHDEVVHGKRPLLLKMPGGAAAKFANLRALYGWMWGHPGKKLLFMGGEFGQRREWSEARQLDWELLDNERHRELRRWVADLNRLHVSEPALHEADFLARGFEWIDCEDAARSLLSFVRRGREARDPVVGVVNLTPVPREAYRLGVPEAGRWRLLADSDDRKYGGSGAGAGGAGEARAVDTEPVAEHGRSQSIVITLPPLSVMFFKPAAG